MRPMHRLFFFLSLFLIAGVCPSAAQNSFDLEDLVGEWFTPDGQKAFTIELAADTGINPTPKQLALKGQFSDWTGKMTADGTVVFDRTPTASQMHLDAKEWAREMVEKEGTLHWNLSLHLREGCSEFVLDGSFYPGLLEWSEETDQSGKVLKRDAHDTKKLGEPRAVRYAKQVSDGVSKHSLKPIDLSGIELDNGSDARRVQFTQIHKMIDKIQTELDTMDADIVKLSENYKKAERRKHNADEATAKLAQKIADQEELEKKAYNLPPREYDPKVWNGTQYEALHEAQLLSAHRAVTLSALGDQLAKAYNARSQKIGDLLEAYKNLGTLPIKLVKIDAVDGGTLISARLPDQPDQDLAALGKQLEDAKLALEIAKPAKDKAFAQFKEEEQTSMKELDLLADMIRMNAWKKFGTGVAVIGLKIIRAALEKGPPGIAMESIDIILEKGFANELERNKVPGADTAAIKKEVEEESHISLDEDLANKHERNEVPGADTESIKKEVQIEFNKGVHELSGHVPEELKEVRNEALSFAGGKSIVAITTADSVTRNLLKSKMVANTVEHYREITGEAIKEPLSEFKWDAAAAAVEGGYKIVLDKQEEELWRDYYRHEVTTKVLFALWQVAAKTYWEDDFDKYDKLRIQMIERLKALESQQFHYEMHPGKFPVHTQECAQLKIAIVPGQPDDHESVSFGKVAADAVSGSSPGEHLYRFTVRRLDDGGAPALPVRVVHQQ